MGSNGINNSIKEEDWCSVYLYYEGDYHEFLHRVVQHVALFFDKYQLSYYFFIRYVDKIGPHIRFRVLLVNNINKKHLLTDLSKKFNDRIISISEEPYKREMQRYYGDRGIDLAEYQFVICSKLVVNITKKIGVLKYEAAMIIAMSLVVIHLKILKSIGFSIKQILSRIIKDWTPRAIEHSKILKIKNIHHVEDLIKKYNELLLSYGNVIELVKIQLTNEREDKTHIEEIDESKLSEKWCIEMEHITQMCFKKLNASEASNMSMHFIHLLNNRLGIRNIDEPFQAYLILHAIKELGND